MTEMSEAAKLARRQYNRDYYAKNKDRIQQQKAEYWARKAAEAARKEKTNENAC